MSQKDTIYKIFKLLLFFLFKILFTWKRLRIKCLNIVSKKILSGRFFLFYSKWNPVFKYIVWCVLHATRATIPIIPATSLRSSFMREIIQPAYKYLKCFQGIPAGIHCGRQGRVSNFTLHLAFLTKYDHMSIVLYVFCAAGRTVQLYYRLFQI